MCIRDSAYFAIFLVAAISAAAPPELEVALMYESASVAATVTSHERGFPVCHYYYIIIIIERKDFGGIMSNDCTNTLCHLRSTMADFIT